MKILVLGGTKFVGRILVETALANRHEITLFNRNKTNPKLFSDIEHLQGDRNSDLTPLHGRKWDVVIDTCGYVPRIVRKSAEMLAASVDHYILISTISVYADFSKPGIDENSPLATIDDESVENVTNETYGPLKVLCEKAAAQTMPHRVLVLRPGLIVGPHDPSDRFTYWLIRMSQGGEVLAPSPPQQQIQFIDVRDLADFILQMAVKKQSGIFNTTGPAYTLTMEEFLQECMRITKATPGLTWVSEKFVLEYEMDLPVWVPSGWHGINKVNCQKAISAGLTFRPFAETIRDTLAWHSTRPQKYELKTGLRSKQEKEFLKTWHDKIG